MTRPPFFRRPILAIGDFSLEELLFVLETARSVHERREELKARLVGRRMYYAFFEPSTRTRFSFLQAAKQLGLETVGFSSRTGTSWQKGEPLKDTLRMIQGYGADVIVMRHPVSGAALWGAESIDVPIVNAGDGAHEHPTQTMLDLFSILECQRPDESWQELRDLGKMVISFVGDLKYGRTVHSLTKALTKFRGCSLRFVAPQSLQLPVEYRDYLDEIGVPYSLHTQIEEVVEETDILYMTRIQKERFPDETEFELVRRAFQLSARHLRGAKRNLRVLHPLPRDKENLELDFSVDASPYAYYYQQAANGLTVRLALLSLVLGGIETPEYLGRESGEPAEESPLTPLALGRSHPDKPRPEYLFTIQDGTVIDHILAGHSGLVKASLRIPRGVPVLVAENLASRRAACSRKDLIKIIGYKPSRSELNQIALISPDATVSFIERGSIVEKGLVRLPRQVRGLLICPNPNCISRPEFREGVESRFRTLSRTPPVLQCHYCDARMRKNEIAFVGRA